MKLADLKPQFVNSHGDAGLVTGTGLECDCPCGTGCGVRLWVPFKQPIGGGREDQRGWERSGETFETLTLTPSILRIKARGGCGWHGFITAGEILTC